jgi:hypothetical protein
MKFGRLIGLMLAIGVTFASMSTSTAATRAVDGKWSDGTRTGTSATKVTESCTNSTGTGVVPPTADCTFTALADTKTGIQGTCTETDASVSGQELGSPFCKAQITLRLPGVHRNAVGATYVCGAASFENGGQEGETPFSANFGFTTNAGVTFSQNESEGVMIAELFATHVHVHGELAVASSGRVQRFDLVFPVSCRTSTHYTGFVGTFNGATA